MTAVAIFFAVLSVVSFAVAAFAHLTKKFCEKVYEMGRQDEARKRAHGEYDTAVDLITSAQASVEELMERGITLPQTQPHLRIASRALDLAYKSETESL